MRKPTALIILALGLMLSGCASIQYPLPSCDGSARRPLNRSVWDSTSMSTQPVPAGLEVVAGAPPAAS